MLSHIALQKPSNYSSQQDCYYISIKINWMSLGHIVITAIFSTLPLLENYFNMLFFIRNGAFYSHG